MFALAAFDVILPRAQQMITGVPLRRYGMPPVIDFLNHDGINAQKAQVEFRYFSDKFSVLSGKDYKPGDEVFISYGAQSNDSLLQYYAFVEQGNPFDTFTFDNDIAAQMGLSGKSLTAHVSGFEASAVRAIKQLVGGDHSKTVTILRELCRAQLDRFETSIDEDTSILENLMEEDEERLRTAVLYRREKKILLKNIVDNWDGKPKKR